MLSALLILSLAACAEKNAAANSGTFQPVEQGGGTETETPTADQLTVRFGDNGASFTMYLEDNDTAAAIARHAGSDDLRLPIYHYDDYERWEAFQYYNILYHLPVGRFAQVNPHETFCIDRLNRFPHPGRHP